jgi:hypothetical protein
MRGEAFAVFAALVLACPDLRTRERVGDHLRNIEKGTLAPRSSQGTKSMR